MVILASLDLFRAYADIGAVNIIFAFKECIIIGLFILYFYINRTKVTGSFIALFLCLILYVILNCRNENGLILQFVFIKYIVVYFFSYLILSHIGFKFLELGCRIVIFIFGVYSIYSVIQGVISPDSLVRAGRISGTANPSFISVIYLYSFIFCFFEKKTIPALWFLFAGILTMTKTYFVTSVLITLLISIFSKRKKHIIVLVSIIIPIVSGIIKNNIELYYTFDRAYKVLVDQDDREYNSMDDRITRIDGFKEKNSGMFLFGYGTGRASSGTTFVKEKLDIDIDGAIDFENQYLNIYYSMGVIGLFLLYFPIIFIVKCVIAKKTRVKEKLEFYLYLMSFLLYSITLNLIESFTGIIISLLFLLYSQKHVCNRYRLSDVAL